MYLKNNTFTLRGSVFVRRNCMMPLVTINNYYSDSSQSIVGVRNIKWLLQPGTGNFEMD